MPKIGIMIDVDAEKMIDEISEVDFEKYQLLYENEETESITEEFPIVNNDIVNIGLHFFLKNVRPYAASCSEA